MAAYVTGAEQKAQRDWCVLENEGRNGRRRDT